MKLVMKIFHFFLRSNYVQYFPRMINLDQLSIRSFKDNTIKLEASWNNTYTRSPHLRYLFNWFRYKQRQLIAECYLHWTTTFEISFPRSSDTNHNSLLQNATYTGPSRLRYLFQVVQTQTTKAYCRMLPTLDHHV